MKNILIFRTHRFGDILQTIPMIQGLKEKYPAATIFFIVDQNYQELIIKSQLIDHVIPIPYAQHTTIFDDKTIALTHILDCCAAEIEQLRELNIDLAVNRSFSNFSALLLYAIQPQRTFGKQFTPDSGYFYDAVSAQFMDTIVHHRKNISMHLVDFGCHLAHAIPQTRQLRFIPDTNDKTWWEEQKDLHHIDEKYRLIGIQLGANKPFRQWGEHNFAALITFLNQLNLPTAQRIKTIILGEASEQHLYQNLISHLVSHSNVLNLMGKTTFGKLAAALSDCTLLITNDTGTMHLATAVNTPVLSLFFASAYYKETGPYGPSNYVIAPQLDCYPCFSPENCPYHYACREAITTEAVIDALRVILMKEPISHLSLPLLSLLTTGTKPITSNIEYIPLH